MAAVAGVLAALLAVAYFVYFPNHKPDPLGALTGNEKAAVRAAGTEAANLATFSRANFDRDYARGLAGTTGALTKQVEALKATTKSTITTGKFDLTAKVQHAGLVGPAESGKSDSYVVLVVLFGYQSVTKNVPNPQNLQVTVVKVKGKWLASDVTQATIQ